MSKTDTTINLLLSGKGSSAKKFAGKHVMVIKDEVVALKNGMAGVRDMDKLTEKYGTSPTLLFVPPPNTTYILCQK